MSVIVAGNLVLDRIAWPVDTIQWAGTVWVENFERSVGGNEAITSFTLAKMGIETSLAKAVGNDRECADLLKLFEQAGVSVSAVQKLALPCLE